MMEGNDMTKNNPQGAGMSRRDFIGGLGVALGGACILGAMDTAVVSAASRKRAILYNTTKCVGCHYFLKKFKELAVKRVYVIRPVLEFEACGFDVTSGLLDVFVQPLKLDVVEE